MKLKSILILFSFTSLFGQKIITEGKFTDTNSEIPLQYSFFLASNEFVLLKGINYSMSYAKKITNACKFDANGTKTILKTHNGLISLIPSLIDDSYLIGDFNGAMSLEAKDYFLINKESEIKDDAESNNKGTLEYFNKDNEIYFSDDKGEGSSFNYKYLKLEKRDYFIHKYDFIKKSFSTLQIQKPNWTELNEKELYKFKNENFKFKSFTNQTFDFTQKTIEKSCNASTLYRYNYDLSGKIIKEYKYILNFENPFTLSSNTGGFLAEGTEMGFNGAPSFSYLTLKDINFAYDYKVDEKTNQTYIFGVLGETGKQNLESKPKGYFIIKYDEQGKKIWEKIEYIDNLKFNNIKKKFSSSDEKSFSLNLIVNNENVKLEISAEKEKFLLYDLLDSTTGISKKSNLIEYDLDRVLAMSAKNYLVFAFYEIEKIESLKKKRFDRNTLFNYDNIPALHKYIDEIKVAKGKVYFNSLQLGKNIWLIESDNETYYKVIIFDN